LVIAVGTAFCLGIFWDMAQKQFADVHYPYLELTGDYLSISVERKGTLIILALVEAGFISFHEYHSYGKYFPLFRDI
jgi:hypothetical protein